MIFSFVFAIFSSVYSSKCKLEILGEKPKKNVEKLKQNVEKKVRKIWSMSLIFSNFTVKTEAVEKVESSTAF